MAARMALRRRWRCGFAVALLTCPFAAVDQNDAIASIRFSRYSPDDPQSATIFELFSDGEIRVSADWLYGVTPSKAYRLTDRQLADVVEQLRALIGGAKGRTFINLAPRHVSAQLMSVRLDPGQPGIVLRSTQNISRRNVAPLDRYVRLVEQGAQEQTNYLLWEDMRDVLQQAVITAASNEVEEEDEERGQTNDGKQRAAEERAEEREERREERGQSE